MNLVEPRIRPDDSSRRSFEIRIISSASPRNAPETSAIGAQDCIAHRRSYAECTSTPEIFASRRTAFSL